MRHKVLPLVACFLLFLGGGLFAQNNARYFDGIDDCVSIGNMNTTATPITTQFTVEAWIKPESINVGAFSLYGRTIFASSTVTDKPIWVTQHGSEIWVYSYSNNDVKIKTVGLGLTANTWSHIAVTVIKNGDLKLYVNGQLVASKTAGNGGTNWNSTFTIGDLRPDRKIAFWGYIDEVRVWNDVRTDTEIQANYDKTVDPASDNLIGYWKLDESEGHDAYDSTGNGYNGIVRSGASIHPNPDPGWTAGVPTLPVELSSFSAILTADLFVRLQWITQSETGVSGFYIYRSIERDIATAMIVSPFIGATNTSDQHSYLYMDTDLIEPGTYYYWLSVHNYDGSVDYHGPTTVHYNQNTNQEVPDIPIISGLKSIYPNPFNPSANISYTLIKDAELSFVISNSRGQIVRRISAGHKAAGDGKITWNGLDDNGNTCSSGVYHIRMNAGKQSFAKKAVLMK